MGRGNGRKAPRVSVDTREKEPNPAVMSLDPLRVDFGRRLVTLAGTEIHLTPIEYDLLRFMLCHPDCVLTYRQLLSQVWGPESAKDRHTLQVHIANLRSKIEPDPSRRRFIRTEPRIGYRFRTEP
jgi:two-component system KDP operon response regulator KdpE